MELYQTFIDVLHGLGVIFTFTYMFFSCSSSATKLRSFTHTFVCMQTFAFALVNCLISNYDWFSILFSLPWGEKGWGVIKQHRRHLASNQGQPTTHALTIQIISSIYTLVRVRSITTDNSSSHYLLGEPVTPRAYWKVLTFKWQLPYRRSMQATKQLPI